VEPPATIREFRKYLERGASVQISLKFCHSHWIGRSVPSGE